MWSIVWPIVIVFSVVISIVLIPYLTGGVILLYRRARILLLLCENQIYFKIIRKKMFLIFQCGNYIKGFCFKIFLFEFKKSIETKRTKEIKRLCHVFEEKTQKCYYHSFNMVEISILIDEILEMAILIDRNKQKMYQTGKLGNLPIVKFTRMIDRL